LEEPYYINATLKEVVTIDKTIDVVEETVIDKCNSVKTDKIVIND